jgi:L-ascorbate metabolism protein UlaG (beta-lactamase superfamily)
MKIEKNRFIPAVKDGKFESSVCNAQESFCAFVFRTSSMLIKSFFSCLNPKKKEPIDWYAPQKPVERSESLIITWIGHSSFLIQIGGINIITDPVFSNATFLYPRIVAPGIALKDLPPIDCVLISHNHIDHMEKASIKILARHKGVQFLVPKGDKSWFQARSIAGATELTWWQSHEIQGSVPDKFKIRYTFLPALHWSQRNLFDRNSSLWGSWMIECQGTTIYFAGDTAYGTHFKEIANEFPSINVALMPIGPCEPRKWMKHAHIDSVEACQAFLSLNAQHFIPMHWGTFHFGNEPCLLPITRLKQFWQEIPQLSSKAILHLPKAGEQIHVGSALPLMKVTQPQKSL